MVIKSLLSTLAIGITLYAFLPYIRSILKSETKPHVFSWIIWGSTTTVVFFAQLAADGGIGAWPIGISGCITIFIAYLAYQHRGDISITRMDRLFFAAAMMSLPFWYLTSDPLWAVVILTVVDVLGFGPTARKAYHFPRTESMFFYTLFTVRNLIVIGALESHSVTTVLFPATISATCIGLIGMVAWRRRAVPVSSAEE